MVVLSFGAGVSTGAGWNSVLIGRVNRLSENLVFEFRSEVDAAVKDRANDAMSG